MAATPSHGKSVGLASPSPDRDWKMEFIAALKDHRADSSTDFTIISGESTFQVHRLVASIHSTYFKRLCDGTSSFKEAADRQVELKDDSPVAVKLMVDYFYTFDYPEPMSSITKPGEGNPRNSLEGHSHVFALADKYDIRGLRELAVSKFKNALQPVFVTTDAFLRRQAADLVSAISHVYANTLPKDHRLRELALAPWKLTTTKSLLKYVKKEDLEALLEEIPEFGVDLLAGIAGFEIGSASGEERVSNDDENKKGRKNVAGTMVKIGDGLHFIRASAPLTFASSGGSAQGG